MGDMADIMTRFTVTADTVTADTVTADMVMVDITVLTLVLTGMGTTTGITTDSGTTDITVIPDTEGWITGTITDIQTHPVCQVVAPKLQLTAIPGTEVVPQRQQGRPQLHLTETQALLMRHRGR